MSILCQQLHRVAELISVLAHFTWRQELKKCHHHRNVLIRLLFVKQMRRITRRSVRITWNERVPAV